MHWNPNRTRYLVACLSLVALAILFHLDNWWANLAAGLYVLALALTVPVGYAQDWNNEKKGWKAIGALWATLLVVCPVMSIFFPDDHYKSLSLHENAQRMGPLVTMGVAVLIVGIIIAMRRKANQPVEEVVA